MMLIIFYICYKYENSNFLKKVLNFYRKVRNAINLGFMRESRRSLGRNKKAKKGVFRGF